VKKNFWEEKTLQQMNSQEWESLCDGCGLCCLEKIETEAGEVYFTDVACRLLDSKTCRCKDYSNRSKRVKDCVRLSAQNTAAFDWLPSTCAYKLIHNGKDIPVWHPLISGDKNSVHASGISVKNRITSNTSDGEWRVLQKMTD
jgi:uncharacterized protein